MAKPKAKPEKKPVKSSKKGSKPKGERVRPSEAMRMIGKDDFDKLVRRCASLKKQGSEISGQMGEMVKSACENKNLDRVAFQMFRKLHAMAPEKLATTLACFDYYRDIGGLDDEAAKQGSLKIARQEAGEKEDGPSGPRLATNGGAPVDESHTVAAE